MIVGARREVLQQCLCLKSPQISRCGGGAEEVGSHEVTQKRSRAVLDVTAAIYDRLGTMFIDEKRVSLPRSTQYLESSSRPACFFRAARCLYFIQKKKETPFVSTRGDFSSVHVES